MKKYKIQNRSQKNSHSCVPLRERRCGTTACPACCGEEKIFCTALTVAAKAGQKSLVLARRAHRTSQGRAPFVCSYVLFESPFASVSTVCRGQPSLAAEANPTFTVVYTNSCTPPPPPIYITVVRKQKWL